MTSPSPIAIETDEEIHELADFVFMVHGKVISHGGFDLSNAISGERRNEITGVIMSVLTPMFTTVFGSTPMDRYGDLFEQLAGFATHFASRHIFADGNKRTTVLMVHSFLYANGLTLNVPDAPQSSDNALYQWIQNVVTRNESRETLARFLRDNAIAA